MLPSRTDGILLSLIGQAFGQRKCVIETARRLSVFSFLSD